MRAPQETNRAELYLQTHGRSGRGESRADSESSGDRHTVVEAEHVPPGYVRKTRLFPLIQLTLLSSSAC